MYLSDCRWGRSWRRVCAYARHEACRARVGPSTARTWRMSRCHRRIDAHGSASTGATGRHHHGVLWREICAHCDVQGSAEQLPLGRPRICIRRSHRLTGQLWVPHYRMTQTRSHSSPNYPGRASTSRDQQLLRGTNRECTIPVVKRSLGRDPVLGTSFPSSVRGDRGVDETRTLNIPGTHEPRQFEIVRPRCTAGGPAVQQSAPVATSLSQSCRFGLFSRSSAAWARSSVARSVPLRLSKTTATFAMLVRVSG